MGSGAVRVLHVDDEPDFAKVAAEFLERENEHFDVETATSAAEGLDRLAETGYDCVVSDHDMPRMDGIDFLERVREEQPDLPFILFTGKGSEEVASEAIRAGVTDYLQKGRDPSQYELLANRITNTVEQYRAERRARMQERQYRELFENAPIMYVLSRDEDGQPVVEDCNERFLDKLGYDRDEVIGRPMMDLYTEESANAVYEGGDYERALSGEFDREHRTLVAKDGERIDTLLRASPRLDEHGDAVGLQTLYLDVTDQREHERELERYETIVEASGDAVHTLDDEGHLTFVNGAFCELVGCAEDELLGEHVSIVMDDADIERSEAIIRDLLTAEREHETVEMDLIDADGERIACETHIALLPDDDDGEFRGTTGIHRDITERKQREQKLQKERNRLSALFDDAPQPMIEGELRGDDHYPIVGVNDAFETTFGYDADEIIGRDIADALVPEDERAEHERFRERVADGESFSGEVERTTVGGDRTFLIDVVPYGTDTTPADGWFATYTDITERKEREQELELYETIVETVPDGVYALDENLRYVAMNQARAELSGYAKDELLGSHMSRINTEEAVEMAKRDRERMLENGVDDEIRTVEQTYVTPDGEEIPCEVRMRALPPADDGSFRGTAGVVRDISERKEREQELRRYEELIENLPIGVYRNTPGEKGEWEFVNEAMLEFLGLASEADLADRSVAEFYADPDARAEFSQTLMEEGVVRDHEIEIETPDGETKWATVTALKVERDGGIYFDSAIKDITEQKEREQELQRERDRLDKFASVVSHDLRNPLNVAEGNVELAREECEAEQLDTVARALDRMDTLIEDILAVAREGTAVESTEPTDLAAVVDTCWRNVDTADATLVVDADATIRADRSRLQQLLENLLRNAVEHGGGDVTVTIGDLDDERGFSLEDDGPGIPADERQRVFEHGYSTTTDGTGFGLAIVREIAEAHGWRIDVTDSTDGGARFEITGVERVE